jgi:hypothetical protein
MSIEDEINRLVQEGSLFRLDQSMPGLAARRTIYASIGVRTLAIGPWANVEDSVRGRELRADFDHFIDGNKIYLRSDNSLEETAFMARLAPPSDEVWEIRSIDPKPSLRVFGSFVERDVFVALTWARRKDLGGRRDPRWNLAISNYKKEWEKNFSNYKPMFGRYPNEYLTNTRIID